MVGTENCDDGSEDNEGCQPGCKLGPLVTWSCSGGSTTTSTICVPICDDGILVGNEDCDDNMTNLVDWRC